MVETVSASPLPQATGNGTVAQGLEPGTELKAKVEANLPGGVVRLATPDAKLELRVPAPLPEGGEVTVTVSGSKQQPAILITVGKEQPQQQPSAPATASQGQASQAPASQAQASQAQAPQVQASKGQTGQAPAQSESGAPLQPQPSTATAYPRPSPVLAHLVQVLSVNTAPGQTAGNAQTLPQTPLPGAPPPTSAPPAASGAQPPTSGNVAIAQPLPPTGASGQTIAGVPPPAGPSPQNSAPTQPAAAPSQGPQLRQMAFRVGPRSRKSLPHHRRARHLLGSLNRDSLHLRQGLRPGKRRRGEAYLFRLLPDKVRRACRT